ncbi:hypothetical protein [Winogradskyella aurantia]|uniref:DUF5723 domain-containing protein n=1 Tax=Winogradskyella aurantia TaxID=1915063 RepID=A0A265V0J4_9FLAO|nr:hypothetical protein [Winogradskyella aurantia]OZV71090.1 hypothetical protein CA834_02965 [Winogradskyella aurantia]
MKFIKFLIVAFSLYSWGQQGNYKYNNFGNRSILLSGNVTGSVSDIGLVYYNPARLTELENTGFAFNAKAYELNVLKLTAAFDEQRQLDDKSFGGVPSMAGGTFTLFGERFGYSFISRRRGNLNLSISSREITDNILTSFPDVENYNLKASIESNVKEDWYGLTWAHKVNSNLSLGISGFATSYRYSGGRSISQTIQYNQDNVAYFLNRIGFEQKSYGLEIKIGANYKINSIDIGLNINVPYIEIFEEGSYNYNEVIAGVSTGSDVFYDYAFNDLNAKRKEPFGISIGAGIPVKKSRIHLNIDYVAGLSKYSRIDVPEIDIGEPELTTVLFNEQRSNVFNFGVGGEIYMSEKLKSYFGFSTDFNAFKTNATAFDISTSEAADDAIGADFYHLSGGIDWAMSWANIILGVTYASGSSRFQNPFEQDIGSLEPNNSQESNLKNQRYQLIIGLEIPILDNTFKKLKEKVE